MASRVNVRFVVFLAIGLIVLAGGVVIAGVIALRKSGPEYVQLGDKKMQEASGELDKEKKAKAIMQAATYYSRAVFKQATNSEWCAKWLEALEKLTPTPQQAYIDTFKGDYTLAWVALRDSAPEDVAVQRRYLDWTYERVRRFSPGEVTGWQQLAEEAKNSIDRFSDPKAAAVLRRYEGIANTNIVRIQSAAQSGSLVGQAREALEAALGADPSDMDSTISLASWKVLKADEVRPKDPAQADKLIQEAHDLLANYLKSYPVSPAARLTAIQLAINQAIHGSGNKLTWGQLYINFHDQIEELFKSIKEQKPEDFDATIAVASMSIAFTSPKIGPDGAMAILDDLLKKYPDDATLLLTKGRAALRARKIEEAMQVFQRVADMPDLPLSLRGVALFGDRAEAMVQQVNATLSRTSNEMPVEERQKIIEEAKKYRQKLVDYAGEGELAVLLLDAKILISENKYAAARIKLDDYNRRSDNKNGEVLMLLGDVLSTIDSPGAAKLQYEAALRRDQTNFLVMLRLADAERKVNNLPKAIEYYDMVLGIQPANEDVKKARAELAEIADAINSPDPEVKALGEAQAAYTAVPPDRKKAGDILKAAISKASSAKTDDVRLYRFLAQVLFSSDDREGANKTVAEGLAKWPDDVILKGFSKSLNDADPLQTAIDNINASPNLSEIQKCVQRALVYRSNAKDELAAAEIAKAAAIDKNNPAVIELMFADALRKGNIDEAKKLVEAAIAANADNVNGLTFVARMQMLERKIAEAASTLEQALEKDRNNMAVWRLLGAVRFALSQLDASVKAYAKALEIKPDDADAIIGYLKAKVGLRAMTDALTFAREKQGFVGHTPEFIDLWMNIESIAPGGDKKKAEQVRRELATRDPNNEQNNYALAVLYIDARQWDEAKKLIDILRKNNKEAVKYFEVEAHWNLAQGKLQGAADVFGAYLKDLPLAKHNEDPYISMAALLMRYGQTDAALATLQDGVKRQDTKTLRADRELGESYFNLGRFDKALESFTKIAASNPADLDVVNTRIISALVRAGRLNEARAKLDAMGDAVNTSAGLVVLKGDVLTGLGDRENAQKQYDQAIALNKSDAFNFVKRGDFLMATAGREVDAEDDLKQAILLDPRMYIARQRLAVLYLRQDKLDAAAGVLKEGIAADPDNTALRVDLIDVHVIGKQADQAVVQLEQAVKRSPGDAQWLARGRETMALLERWNDAADYAMRLWEKNKSAGNAMSYVDAALKTDKPDFTKIMGVLATPELNVAKDPRLLILRSRVQVKRGRAPEATQDLATALSLVDHTKLQQVGTFFAGLETIYPDAKDQLAALKVLEPKTGYKAWFELWLNKVKSENPETRQEGIAGLRRVGEGTDPNEFRTNAYAALGSHYHTEKMLPEALAAWRKGLEIDPNEPELNNNVAYTLATEQNKPEEALPYADKAALALPDNSSILDTLGTVYLAMKKYDKAEQYLLRAHAYTSSEMERATIFLHLGKLRAAQGNKSDAQKYMIFVSELMKRNATVRERVGQDYAKVKAEVDQL